MLLVTKPFMSQVLAKASGGTGGFAYMFAAYEGAVPTMAELQAHIDGLDKTQYTASDVRNMVTSLDASSKLLVKGSWNESVITAEFLNPAFLRLPLETVDNELEYVAEGSASWALIIGVTSNASDYESTTANVNCMYAGPVGDIGSAEPFELLTTLVENIRDHSLANFEINFRS